MFKRVFLYLFVAFNFFTALAANCNITGDEAPEPGSLVCIISRVINIGLFAVGLIFVGIVAYGAIKLAMSLGDPKGFQGARMFLTYGVMGLAVILLAGSILVFMSAIFGVQLDPNSMMGMMETSINNIFDLVRVNGGP